MTFPARSEIATVVLLKVAFTWAIPAGTLRTIFFFTRTAAFFSGAFCSCLAKGHPLCLDFLVGNGFALAFAGTGVRAGSLSAHRQANTVAYAAVAMDANEALNIVLNLASQIPFNDILGLKDGVQASDRIFCELASAHIFVQTQFLNNLFREFPPYSVDVGQAHF
jgi:hypothetical protein